MIKNIKKMFYNLAPNYLVTEVNINLLWQDINNHIRSKKEIIINIEDAKLIFDNEYKWENYVIVKRYVYNSYYIKEIREKLLKEWIKLENNIKKGLPIKNKNSIVNSKIIIKIEIEMYEIKFKKLSYEEYLNKKSKGAKIFK